MSKLFHKDKPIIGLDISATSIKIMSVDVNKWAVNGYGSIDVDPTKMKNSIVDSDGQFLAEQIKDLIQNKIQGTFSSNHVAMSIPTSLTYSRSITVSNNIESSIEDSVKLEASQYIPIPVSQLYIDYEVTSRDEKTTTALMCAVPKKIVDNCIRAAAESGLKVILVEPGMLSVSRLLHYTESGELPTVIVDIGSASTDVAIVDGTLKVTGGLPVGGNTLTRDISESMNVTVEKARQLKVLSGLSAGPNQRQIVAALEPDLNKIVSEIKKIIRYYNERLANSKAIEQVVIVGGGSNVPGIGDYLTDKLMIASRVASPWQMLNFGRLSKPDRRLAPRYLTVAGVSCVKPKEIWK